MTVRESNLRTDNVNTPDFVRTIRNNVSIKQSYASFVAGLGGGGGASNLCDLLDVDCSGIQSGDTLQWCTMTGMFVASSTFAVACAPPFVPFGFGCLDSMALQVDIFLAGFESTSFGVHVSPDGVNHYTIEPFAGGGSGRVRRMVMGTPNDLSTGAVAASGEFFGTGEVHGVSLTAAGDIMLLTENSTVRRFTLSTAFDSSTLTPDETFATTSSAIRAKFSDDGNWLYVLDDNSFLRGYPLPTPNSLVGIGFPTTLDLFSFIGGGPNPTDFLVTNSGERLYLNNFGSTLLQADMSTPYDLSTAALRDGDGLPFSLDTGEGNLPGLAADSTLEHFYVHGNSIDERRYTTLFVNTCP